ncbi:hypothetical protein C8R47DRAFT_668665 [Mycena vitilis]|nr:hypothetical protein C8R47DRAFT_668665 [Mycena vitilis]
MPVDVDPRASIYALSCIAYRLQRRSIQSDETSRNLYDSRVRSTTELGRTLNHLATCLTRGRNDEKSRIISVTMGPLTLDGAAMTVAASPPSSPPRSPNISPSSSSSAGIAKSTDSHETEDAAILARNFAKDEEGLLIERTIPPCNASTTTLRSNIALLTATDATTIATEPFSDFVEKSLTLLRDAATMIDREPDTKAATTEQVLRYFIISCWPKIQQRVQQLNGSYKMEILDLWEGPTIYEKDFVSTSNIPISHRSVKRALTSLGVCTVKPDTFLFEGSNASLWWQALVTLVLGLKASIELSPIDPQSVSAFSSGIHYLLKAIPPQLWTLNSLGHFLQRSRRGVRPQ